MIKITARLLAAVLLGAGSFSPALAQPTVEHPVKVTTCDPRQNATASYGPAWTPAYYPYRGNPWYWNDVYGAPYYQPAYVQNNPTLGIDYTNQTSKVMKQIEFGLIANGNLVAEVRDVGTFSPGVEIKHEFGLSENVFPLQTGLPHCVPLRITFADGTHWRNPRLPGQPRRQMYETPSPR